MNRGIADQCTREDLTASSQAAPARLVAGQIDGQPDIVKALLARVSQLESKLEQKIDDARLRPSNVSNTLQSLPVSPQSLHVRSQSTIPAVAQSGADDAEGDAITVLEFLAWGRKKNAEFGHSPEDASGPRRHSLGVEEHSSSADFLSTTIQNVQLDMLEALLPSKTHIQQLVEYHNQSLLWYHGSYSSRTINDDLHAFFRDHHGSVRHKDLNMQWLALLFAILCSSLTCAAQPICRNWGFSDMERISLSSKWYEATVTCLNMARYIEIHSIYSVQAISTLTISAHMLGLSNSQSVLLISAGRIAQSLGLHRLSSEAESASTTVEQKRKRETARRVFIQLCIQDWFSIPFSDSYALDPKYWKTVKPMNCNDEDMSSQSSSVPTESSYCNYRYDIAALMPQLLDAVSSCNTLFTKYEQVLQYDDKMRKLVTAYIPTFLSTTAPVASSWPQFVGWARRSLTICAGKSPSACPST